MLEASLAHMSLENATAAASLPSVQKERQAYSTLLMSIKSKVHGNVLHTPSHMDEMYYYKVD